MLTLHLVAKTYHRRPSEIFGIDDEWAAYQFDVAVLAESLADDHDAPSAAPVSWDWSDIAEL